MKKTLVALAALAATASFAQSSVTLSGGLGFGYQKNPLNQKGFALTDFEIKLSGSEDLGGGLRANFSTSLTDAGNVRAGSSTPGPLALSSATGALFTPNTTNPTAPITNPTQQAVGQYRSGLARDTTSLSLVGGFGALTLSNGRSAELAQRAFVAPSSLPDGFYDGNVFGRAAVDALIYTTPNFSGFTANVLVTESGPDGGLASPRVKTLSLVGNYANGPLAVSMAARNSREGILPTILARKTNIEGVITYDFGVAQVGFGFDGKRTVAPSSAVATSWKTTDKNAYALGVAVPIGAFTIGANYAARGTSAVGGKKQTISEFVANYALSKRTAIMFSAGQQTGAPGGDATPVTATSNSAITGLFPAGQLLPGGTTKEASQYRLKLQHNF